MESGIDGCGIRNPRTWNPKSTAWNPESKTLLDYLTWGEKCNSLTNGYRNLLMVLDVFSKYGWIVPLKDKKGETVTEAF